MDGVIIGVAGFVLSLPVCLILEFIMRCVAFCIGTFQDPIWRRRPLSPWKLGDWVNETRRQVFSLEKKPFVTWPAFIARAAAVGACYYGVWWCYVHVG